MEAVGRKSGGMDRKPRHGDFRLQFRRLL